MAANQSRILVVLPHPDDEAFGLSGTLARQIDEGAHVTYACLTLGEMGRNMGVPLFANRITLPQIRKAELEQACRIIGIQDLRMLGFHDKTIEFEDKDKLDGMIMDLIEEVCPQTVYTFYPQFSVHPDHDACGAAVIRTISRIPKEQRPTVYCIAFSHDREEKLGKPDVIVDIKPYLQRKINALKAHRSQFQITGVKEGEPVSEEWLERFGTESFYTYKFD